MKIIYIEENNSIDLYEVGYSKYTLRIKIYEYNNGKIKLADYLYVNAKDEYTECNADNFIKCSENNVIGNIDLLKYYNKRDLFVIEIEHLISYTEEYKTIYIKRTVPKGKIENIFNLLEINLKNYKVHYK